MDENIKDHGLYYTFQRRRDDRQTPVGFLNDIHSTWENLPMEKVRAAIDVQRKICKAVLEAEGKYTKYDTD